MFPSYIATGFDFLQPHEYYISARPSKIDNYFLGILHPILDIIEANQYADEYYLPGGSGCYSCRYEISSAGIQSI